MVKSYVGEMKPIIEVKYERPYRVILGGSTEVSESDVFQYVELAVDAIERCLEDMRSKNGGTLRVTVNGMTFQAHFSDDIELEKSYLCRVYQYWIPLSQFEYHTKEGALASTMDFLKLYGVQVVEYMQGLKKK